MSTRSDRYGCVKCAEADKRDGKPRRADAPCDICNDTRWDYIGRPCRHCNPQSEFYRPANENGR